MLLVFKSVLFFLVSDFSILMCIHDWLEQTDPSSHLLAAGVFGAVGYYVHNLQERQAALMASKKEIMIKNRARAEELASQ